MILPLIWSKKIILYFDKMVRLVKYIRQNLQNYLKSDLILKKKIKIRSFSSIRVWYNRASPVNQFFLALIEQSFS